MGIQAKLAGGAIAADVQARVVDMGAALASFDFATANKIQVSLTSTSWAEHKDWLKGIKYMIALATKKLKT